jgi:dolichol-phosphate mannosyltransferase
MLSVSIIIPTYNERDNVPILARRLTEVLTGRSHEIIVVDDDSPDGTSDVVRSLSKEIPPLRLITKKKKEGIGAALRLGYDTARNEVLLSMDADLSWDCEDIPRLLHELESGADMVLGSRHMSGGAYEAPSTRVRLKRIISTMGNRVVRWVTGVNVRDYSSNFRAIRRSVWHKVETQENTNSLLIETVLKVVYGGFAVREVPVSFKDRIHGESKLNLAIEAPKFLIKLAYFVLTLRILGKGIKQKENAD